MTMKAAHATLARARAVAHEVSPPGPDSMATIRTTKTASTAQSALPPVSLPRPFKPGKRLKPDIQIWERLREDLFKKSGQVPTHKATMADVNRVIARAEKNGVTPAELLALTSIKSTQWSYFEGGSDSAAWKKLNQWTQDQRFNPVLTRRLEGEFDRRLTNGKLTPAGAQKVMEWVRGENSLQGAKALRAILEANAKTVSPGARVLFDAFLSATP